uniref:Uncharacterized protein n=1 Tax=Panagrolaimus superbus TaxID=310955 RepID=A0A914XSI9_9BILA
MACMSTTSTVPLTALRGEPGDPGNPGQNGIPIIRGKRAIEGSQDFLHFITQETNFKRAKKLIENERENLLLKLKSSTIIYEEISKEFKKPLFFDSDGGYITSSINLETLEDWKICYFFAENVMLLNNEDSTKGIKMVVSCNGEKFY